LRVLGFMSELKLRPLGKKAKEPAGMPFVPQDKLKLRSPENCRAMAERRCISQFEGKP